MRLIIIDMDHPSLQAGSTPEKLEKMPHVRLDDIKEFWGQDYKQLIEIIQRILNWESK